MPRSNRDDGDPKQDWRRSDSLLLCRWQEPVKEWIEGVVNARVPCPDLNGILDSERGETALHIAASNGHKRGGSISPLCPLPAGDGEASMSLPPP